MFKGDTMKGWVMLMVEVVEAVGSSELYLANDQQVESISNGILCI